MRKFLCLDPDPPSAPAGGGQPPPKPDTSTSADVVKSGKTEREINLEKKVATLEDRISTLTEQGKEFTKFIEAATKLPSITQPGNPKRSALDDLVEFWDLNPKA